MFYLQMSSLQHDMDIVGTNEIHCSCNITSTFFLYFFLSCGVRSRQAMSSNFKSSRKDEKKMKDKSVGPRTQDKWFCPSRASWYREGDFRHNKGSRAFLVFFPIIFLLFFACSMFWFPFEALIYSSLGCVRKSCRLGERVDGRRECCIISR